MKINYVPFLLVTLTFVLFPSNRASTDAFVPSSTQYITHLSKKCPRVALSYAPSLAPNVHESDEIPLISVSEEQLQRKRNYLKKCLLGAADEYKASQATLQLLTSTMDENKRAKGDRSYAVRLFSRIVKKILRRRSISTTSNINDDDDDSVIFGRERSSSKNILSKDKFRNARLDTGRGGEAIIDLANQLIRLNPTPFPNYGFRGYGNGKAEVSKLNGLWKLRFTTAADATFSESLKRGKISTSQEIDSTKGSFTNIVDFEKGNLDGFRVVVEGEPVSGSEIDLSFRKVEILRKSRFPHLFGKVSFRLPSKLIRRIFSGKKVRGPFLRILYLDDDLRIHESGTGNIFIQSRIE